MEHGLCHDSAHSFPHRVVFFLWQVHTAPGGSALHDSTASVDTVGLTRSPASWPSLPRNFLAHCHPSRGIPCAQHRAAASLPSLRRVSMRAALLFPPFPRLLVATRLHSEFPPHQLPPREAAAHARRLQLLLRSQVRRVRCWLLIPHRVTRYRTTPPRRDAATRAASRVSERSTLRVRRPHPTLN